MPVYLRYFRKYSHRIEGFGFLGLSKGILDNIITGERNLDFNLKLTKAIVIEIYLCMIKIIIYGSWELFRETLLKISTFNKVVG